MVDLPACVGFFNDLPDMRVGWTKVKNGFSEQHRAIKLTGMNATYHRCSHGDEMNISGRERIFYLIQWLVGERDDMPGFFGCNEVIDRLFSLAATNEEKDESFVVCEGFGGIEKGVERMNRAVIAAIHEDEFILQLVLLKKGILVPGNDFESLLKGPWRDNEYLVVQVWSFLSHVGGHEFIRCDDSGGSLEEAPVKEIENPGREALRANDSLGDCLIGIQIHDPEVEWDAPDQANEPAYHPSDWWGGRYEDRADFWKEEPA